MKKWFTTAILSTALAFPLITNPTQAASFTDIPSSHWANKEITNLSNQNILIGFRDGTFLPDKEITRAQAAKILALSLKITPSANYKPNYKDVTSDHWAFEYISPLTERGIFNNSDHFNPDEKLTRAQMAKILAEGYKLIIDDNHQLAFRDVTKENHFHGYITTIAEVEITNIPNGGIFNPNGKVTRAQLAAFVTRAMQFDLEREKGVIYYDSDRRMYIDKNKPVPLPPVITVPTEATATIDVVNKHRALSSASALMHDFDLSLIAQAKAEDMATKNYFDHHSPTFGSVGDMLAHFNYSWTSYGENIAAGQQTPEAVVTAWMKSQGHRENILNSNFTNIGVGYAVDKNGKPFWVHIFSKK